MKLEKNHILIFFLIVMLILIWNRVFYKFQGTEGKVFHVDQEAGEFLDWTIAKKQVGVLPNELTNPFQSIQKRKKTEANSSPSLNSKAKRKIKPVVDAPLLSIEYKGCLKGARTLAYLIVKGEKITVLVNDSIDKGVFLKEVWSDSIKVVENEKERIIYR